MKLVFMCEYAVHVPHVQHAQNIVTGTEINAKHFIKFYSHFAVILSYYIYNLFRLWPYGLPGQCIKTSRGSTWGTVGQCQMVLMKVTYQHLLLYIKLDFLCFIGIYVRCTCSSHGGNMLRYVLDQLDGSQWNSHD